MVKYRSRKSRGATAERDLVHKFWEKGWAAMRAAGSGSTTYPSPDIIAGKAGRRIVIEAKITIDDHKYLTKDELRQLQYFADVFAAEAWIAVKFLRTPWMFFKEEDLLDAKSSMKATKELGDLKSLSFEELIDE